MCVCVCVCERERVCNYLVICPNVSSEDRKVVKPKRHIIAHILVKSLIIWAGVTMETHTWTLSVAKLSADKQLQI